MQTVNADSKFRFILVSAHRAEQLLRGARPRVDMPGQKHTRIAMEELRRGLIDWAPGPAPGSAPEAPQVEETESAG